MDGAMSGFEAGEAYEIDRFLSARGLCDRSGPSPKLTGAGSDDNRGGSDAD